MPPATSVDPTTLPASGADIKPEADRILRQMTDHLAGLKTLAVTASFGYRAAAPEVLVPALATGTAAPRRPASLAMAPRPVMH